MTRDDIIRMAREARLAEPYHPMNPWSASQEALERFAALIAAHEREACAKIAQGYARVWWGIHCATNKHMETTRKAHEDFCKIDNAIRARGIKNEN